MVSMERRFRTFQMPLSPSQPQCMQKQYAKGVDKPADGLLRMFYKRLGPDHPAVEQMGRMLKAMGRALELTRLGWLEQASAIS